MLASTIAGVLLLAAPRGSAAQELRTVTARVVAAADSTPLPGVTALVLGTAIQGITDTAGLVELRGVPLVPFQVALARLGVIADTVTVPASQNAITIVLQTSAFELEGLVATAVLEARRRFEETAQTSTVSVNRDIVQTMPAFIEADVIRTVQLLPGTVALNDYSIGFSTRGGETDQNLIQLDGIPVFNPSHLGGLFSSFDAAAVDEVEFITGGFPAKYGGRLSSVLDVGLRTGRDRFHASGQVSFLSSKLLLEGGIPGTRGTYLVGARRTYADKVVDVLTEEVLPYYFTDGVAKAAFPLSSGGVISFTGYLSRDILDWEFVEADATRDPARLRVSWGNNLVGVNVDHEIAGRPVSFQVGASDFRTRIGLFPSIVRLENSTRLFTAKGAVDLVQAAGHRVRAGAGVEDYRMEFTLESEALSSSFYQATYQPRVWSAHIDDQWQPTRQIMVRPGIRFEGIPGSGFAGLSPRIAAKYFLTADFALTGSAGRYYQPIHSLRDHNVPWSFVDFWIGADSVTPVASSDHVVAGLEYWMGSGLSATLEGYHKTFHNVLNFDERDDPRVQGDEFIPVDGSAYGLDLLVRKHTGKVTGWVSYSFGKARRRNDVQEFAPAQDRRHTINVVLQTEGPLASQVGVRWGYGSGLPYTEFVGEWEHRTYDPVTDTFEEQFQNTEPIANPALNTRRYPDYGRLDISLRWRRDLFGGVILPYLQLVNAYNRGNVFFYVFDYTQSPATRQGISQLPFLPSFGFEFEF